MEATNDEIRKVLAEFMGWDDFWEAYQGGRHWLMGMHPAHQGYYALENDRIELPDYTHDLNAMHEVEAELERRDLHNWYIELLGKSPEGKPFGLTLWQVIHATAEQRAKAAFSVISNMGG